MNVESFDLSVLLRLARAAGRKRWMEVPAVLCIWLCTYPGSVGAEVPVPPGLDPGDTYQLVFTTFNTRALNPYLDLLDVVAFVNAEAEAAGIGTNEGISWRPIVSYGSGPGSWQPRDRAQIGTNTPVYNLNLQLVASGFSDFWDGTHWASVSRPGGTSGSSVWTGSNIDGTAAEGLTLADATVRIGSSAQADERWINNGTSSRTNRNSYYALSEEITAHFAINAGLSDAWFDRHLPGQGVFITVLPDTEKIFLAWLTYDIERPSPDVTAMLGGPGHRWLTAFGGYSGRTATLDVGLTSGGRFHSGPNPTQTQGYGTITLDFSDCETLSLRYDLPALSLTGSISLTRLATDNVELCEALMVGAATKQGQWSNEGALRR